MEPIRITLRTELPAMNEIIAWSNQFTTKTGKRYSKYSSEKKEITNSLKLELLHHRLPPFPKNEQRNLVFQLYARDARKDPDNLYFGACKMILDAMVKVGLLHNDNQRNIGYLAFGPVIIDKDDPRLVIEVT